MADLSWSAIQRLTKAKLASWAAGAFGVHFDPASTTKAAMLEKVQSFMDASSSVSPAEQTEFVIWIADPGGNQAIPLQINGKLRRLKNWESHTVNAAELSALEASGIVFTKQ